MKEPPPTGASLAASAASRSLIAAFCLLLCGARLPAQAPARDASASDAPGTSVIRGRVTLSGSDDPIPRALVRVISPALKTPRTTKTGADGRYEIAGLRGGRYSVAVTKANFVAANFGQRRPGGPGTPFDLADGQAAGNVDLRLFRAGVISGRVLDEFGDPAADVAVATLRYQFMNGERRLAPAGARSVSNDIGEFRLFGLAPGDYIVSASLQSFAFGDTDDRSAYAATYYPGTPNPSQAQRITIAPGQTVGDLTLGLQPARAMKISGVALDASGKPMAGAMVMAMGRNLFDTNMRPAQVRPDGRFTIGGVVAGDYILRADHRRDDGDQEEAMLPITVSDADIADVQLVAVRPSTVRGRVVFQGEGQPPNAASVRLSLVPSESTRFGAASTTMKEDRTFELKASPGRDYVRSPTGGGWRLKRVTLDGQDVTDSAIEIAANASISNVVVELTSDHADISGTVTSANGDFAQDCWVIVFARDERRWTPQTPYVLAGRPTQRNNKYQVRVLPGDYLAVALDAGDVETGEWTDPQFLGRMRDYATPFSATNGEPKTLDLKLTLRTR